MPSSSAPTALRPAPPTRVAKVPGKPCNKRGRSLLGSGERQEREQLFLRGVALAALRRLALVAALAVHDPALAVVVEVGLEPLLDDARLQPALADREVR